jgi:uncharacterized membrane protein HdeD (DUF308 family)
MFDARGPHWWAIALRGLATILFGLAMFIWPGLSLQVLIALFGVYALVEGIGALVAAFVAGEANLRWWPLALVGLLSIAAGIVAFARPGLTAEALLYLIAAWALVTGLFEIVAAFELRRLIADGWLLALSGAFSALFGVLLFADPPAGILSILWLIGIYAIAAGVTRLVLAFRLRKLQEQVQAPAMS